MIEGVLFCCSSYWSISRKIVWSARQKNESISSLLHILLSSGYCLSNAMHSVGQNVKSLGVSGVRPASAHKIATTVLDRSSPDLEHSFPLISQRKEFLGGALNGCGRIT